MVKILLPFEEHGFSSHVAGFWHLDSLAPTRLLVPGTVGTSGLGNKTQGYNKRESNPYVVGKFQKKSCLLERHTLERSAIRCLTRTSYHFVQSKIFCYDLRKQYDILWQLNSQFSFAFQADAHVRRKTRTSSQCILCKEIGL